MLRMMVMMQQNNTTNNIGNDKEYCHKLTHLNKMHDDVIKWKHFPRYWPFVREFPGPRWIPRTKANNVIMGAMASQITNLTIVYSTVYSGADQRKQQSSALLAFVMGIHRWPVNFLAQRASNTENVSICWRHHDLHHLSAHTGPWLADSEPPANSKPPASQIKNSGWVTGFLTSLIARFMGPTWGPSAADRTQMGPMLTPWTFLSGMIISL